MFSSPPHLCPPSIAWMLDNPLRRWLHPPERMLNGFLHPGDTAADLGCGPGHFTLGMARLVGESGHVYAVDMQAEMLAMVERKARRQGLLERLTLHQAQAERIGLEQPVDFALAFWMVHEVPDQRTFLHEVYALLKPGGRFLLVEPRGEVSEAYFRRTCELAQAAGFRKDGELKVKISMAVSFSKITSPS